MGHDERNGICLDGNNAKITTRMVIVTAGPGGGNCHFHDLQTIANDVRKAEKT